MRPWHPLVVAAIGAVAIVWLALRDERRAATRASPLAIVDVRTERAVGGGVFVEARYRPPADNLVQGRIACAVGAHVFVEHGEWYADTRGNADDQLDHALVFIEHPLPGRPSRCQIDLAQVAAGQAGHACVAVPASDAPAVPDLGACDPPIAATAPPVTADAAIDEVTARDDGHSIAVGFDVTRGRSSDAPFGIDAALRCGNTSQAAICPDAIVQLGADESVRCNVAVDDFDRDRRSCILTVLTRSGHWVTTLCIENGEARPGRC